MPYYHFTTLEPFCIIYRDKKIRVSRCNIAKNLSVETMALYSELKKILNDDASL